MTHQETKNLIDRYHERAVEIYQHTHIHISNIKNVQICETGAFVEAMIWVPKEEIDV